MSESSTIPQTYYLGADRSGAASATKLSHPKSVDLNP